MVARSAEQKAEPAVSIPSVVPANLTTAVAEDEDLATRFDSIESALQALSQGQMIVVLDDEKRENEGDLIMAADKACVLAFDSSFCLQQWLECILAELTYSQAIASRQ